MIIVGMGNDADACGEVLYLSSNPNRIKPIADCLAGIRRSVAELPAGTATTLKACLNAAAVETPGIYHEQTRIEFVKGATYGGLRASIAAEATG